MPNFEQFSCFIFDVLNSIHKFSAQVVSRMKEFYVSTVSFCDNIHATEFSSYTVTEVTV